MYIRCIWYYVCHLDVLCLFAFFFLLISTAKIMWTVMLVTRQKSIILSETIDIYSKVSFIFKYSFPVFIHFKTVFPQCVLYMATFLFGSWNWALFSGKKYKLKKKKRELVWGGGSNSKSCVNQLHSSRLEKKN